MLCYRRMNYLSLKLFLDFYESVVPFKLVNVYGVCVCGFGLCIVHVRSISRYWIISKAK